MTRPALECQAVIDKLLVAVFGTIGRFPARVVGVDTNTVYVYTSQRLILKAVLLWLYVSSFLSWWTEYCTWHRDAAGMLKPSPGRHAHR